MEIRPSSTERTDFLATRQISRFTQVGSSFDADHQLPLGTTEKVSTMGKRCVPSFSKTSSMRGRTIVLV